MTKLSLRSADIPSLYKFAIGFDNMFDELMRVSNHNSSYPPFNICRTGDNTFIIELAIAGFTRGDISLSLENRLLTVNGHRNEEILNWEYIHRGISSRDFKQQYSIAEHVEVVDAEVKDGILRIYLERKVPLEKQAKIIDIRYGELPND